LSPFLGKQTMDLGEPVIKTTYAIFALREDFKQDQLLNCINCGECRRVCPVGLDPEELYKKTQARASGAPPDKDAEKCHGCACCEVVCPSHLPLSTAIIDRRKVYNG
jgi:electron transport complex protein RnfC